MRVRVIYASTDGCPHHVLPYLAANVPVTLEREYEVHAATVFDGVCLLLIIDDLGYPSWQPVWLFRVIDTAMPPDWICNCFNESNITLGPRFIAQNEESYSGMVELESEQVVRFWNRVDELSAGAGFPG